MEFYIIRVIKDGVLGYLKDVGVITDNPLDARRFFLPRDAWFLQDFLNFDLKFDFEPVILHCKFILDVLDVLNKKDVRRMEFNLILAAMESEDNALIYSDWLEENNRTEEAEYIRQLSTNSQSKSYSDGYGNGNGNGYGNGNGNGNGDGDGNGNGDGDGDGDGNGYGNGSGNGNGNGNGYGDT